MHHNFEKNIQLRNMRTLISTILFLTILDCVHAQINNVNEYNHNLFDKLNELKQLDKNFDISVPSNSKLKKEKEKGRIYYSINDYVDGYIKILTLGNDDMKRGLQSQNPLKSEYPIKIIFYKDSIDKKGTKIRADKIIGFEKGCNYYSSEKLIQKPPFYIERIIDGYIELFVFTYNVTNSSSMNNMTMYTTNYITDFFIKDKNGYLIKLNCENIDIFIQANFSDYPGFVEKMLEKKEETGKIFKEETYLNNTCNYIIELVQLKNFLETHIFVK